VASAKGIYDISPTIGPEIGSCAGRPERLGCPTPAMPFSSAHPSLRKTLTARGFVAPTPVQAAILAPDVDVRDVLVSAQTGSGKTAAFGLALAKTLLGDDERFTAAGAPRALIVTPTRELAAQVEESVRTYGKYVKLKSSLVYGGVDLRLHADAAVHQAGFQLHVLAVGAAVLREQPVQVVQRVVVDRDPRRRREPERVLLCLQLFHERDISCSLTHDKDDVSGPYQL